MNVGVSTLDKSADASIRSLLTVHCLEKVYVVGISKEFIGGLMLVLHWRKTILNILNK